MLSLQVFDEARRRRAEPPYPFHLLRPRTRLGEDAIREMSKRLAIVRLVDGEAADEDASDAIRALAVLVLPRPRVGRGRGQHLDVVTRAQLLREQPAGMWCACGDFGAVTRRDEAEF